MRSRMDYILHSNRQEADGDVLGKVKCSDHVLSRNAWSVCPKPVCKSITGVLQDNQVWRNNMLQQAACTGMIITPSPKNKTKFQMSWHQKKLLCHKTSLLREFHLYTCLLVRGYLSPVAPTDTKTTIKFRMWHTGKEGNKNGNKTRIPKHTNPDTTKRRCSLSHKKKQGDGWHITATQISRQQGNGTKTSNLT